MSSKGVLGEQKTDALGPVQVSVEQAPRVVRPPQVACSATLCFLPATQRQRSAAFREVLDIAPHRLQPEVVELAFQRQTRHNPGSCTSRQRGLMPTIRYLLAPAQKTAGSHACRRAVFTGFDACKRFIAHHSAASGITDY